MFAASDFIKNHIMTTTTIHRFQQISLNDKFNNSISVNCTMYVYKSNHFYDGVSRSTAFAIANVSATRDDNDVQ